LGCIRRQGKENALASVRYGTVVNPSIQAAIVSVAASILVAAITALFRTIANGFKAMKEHLNSQDQSIISISQRVAKIEGKLESPNRTGNP